jgi:short-subunit dehydrogenase
MQEGTVEGKASNLQLSFSVVALTQLVIPHLKKSKGTIVNVSSVGSFRPVRVLSSAIFLWSDRPF